MLISSKKIIFFLFLVSGIFLSISSDSWFGVWCGLELNLMSFIPFISSKEDVYMSEASLKYFLIQALGSVVIVFGALQILLIYSMDYLMVVALLLKMGAAPLHFWFPHVMSGLSWLNCMVLMSLQKIAPMLLLSYLTLGSIGNFLIFWSGLLCAVVGSLGGLNQVFLRKIMAFSSINHMSWMLFGMMVSESIWFMYFVFYVTISCSIIYLFYSQQMFHISQLAISKWSFLSVIMFMSLLSLGGLPPFSGFIPKWILIQEMVEAGLLIPLLFLLPGTLVSLYYYLRLALVSFSMSSVSNKWSKTFFFDSKKMSLFMTLNFVGLLFPSFFMLL